MAWTRWVFDKAYNTCANVVGYIDYAVSPVKPLVKAIYNSLPFTRFRQGVSKIQYLPSLVSHDGQTASILRNSSLMMMQYLAFAWSVMVIEKMIAQAIPEEIPYLESTLLWTVRLGFFVPRYFFRRIIDNMGFTVSIPRAVNDDIDAILVEEMSEHLARCLWPGFKSRFFRHSNVGDTIDENEYYRNFVIQLHQVFEEFFSQNKNKINEITLQTLVNPLREVIYDILNLSGTTVPNDVIVSLSREFAQLAVSEFALCFSSEFIETVTTLDDQFEKKLIKRNSVETTPLLKKAAKQRDDFKKELNQALAKNYLHTASAQAYSQELMDIAINLRTHVHPFLPIPYVKPCECDFGEHVDGELKSPLHYIGRVLSFMLPDLAWYLGLLNDTGYNLFWYLISGMRALNFGQSIYEYLIASQFQCTMHRSNKTDIMHSLGLGVGYLGISEVLARFVRSIFGVDNFLSRDAIENFVMQAIIAAAIADRAPKVGMNNEGWDVFLLPRWLTNQAINGIKWLAFSDLDEAKGREKTVEKIKTILSSPALQHVVILLFDENALFPKQESWQRVITDIHNAYQQFVAPYQKPLQQKYIQEEKQEKKLPPSMSVLKKTESLKNIENDGLFCKENLKRYYSPVFDENAEKHTQLHINEIKYHLRQQKRTRHFLPFVMSAKVPETKIEKIAPMELPKPCIAFKSAQIEKRSQELPCHDDVMQVLCRYPGIQLILRTFRNEIDTALSAIKMGQSLTKWVPDSILVFPLPSAFSAFAHLALLLLRNQSFANALQQFDLQMLLIRSLPKDFGAKTQIVRNIMDTEFHPKHSQKTVNIPFHRRIIREEKIKKRIDTISVSLLSDDAIVKALNREETELRKEEKVLTKVIHAKQVTIPEEEKKNSGMNMKLIDDYTDVFSETRSEDFDDKCSDSLIREEPEEYEMILDERDSKHQAKHASGITDRGMFGRLSRITHVLTPSVKPKKESKKPTPIEMRTI